MSLRSSKKVFGIVLGSILAIGLIAFLATLPRAWKEIGPVRLPFDPIDHDASTAYINSPQDVTLKIDLTVTDPDGQPVKDFYYSLDFVVPGRYGEDIGTNGFSDGPIQFTQPGATACRVFLKKDGFYEFEVQKLHSGDIDEATRTITYKKVLVMQPHDPTLPELQIFDRIELKTVFKSNPGSSFPRDATVQALAIRMENDIVTFSMDALTSPVIPNQGVSYLFLDYESYPGWPEIVDPADKKVYLLGGFRPVIRLASVVPADGLLPAIRYGRGNAEGKETTLLYARTYSLDVQEWAPLERVPGVSGAFDAFRTLNRQGSASTAPAAAYSERVLLHRGGVLGNSRYGAFVRVKDLYGKIFTTSPTPRNIDVDGAGQILDFGSLECSGAIFLNTTGSRDLRLSPDYEVDSLSGIR